MVILLLKENGVISRGGIEMDLTIINQNGKLLVDSREVAEMIDKKHAHLMRDIQGYEKIISENPKLDSQDFFIKDTYKVKGNNKTYDCYKLTKQGCEMVANKSFINNKRGRRSKKTIKSKRANNKPDLKRSGLN